MDEQHPNPLAGQWTAFRSWHGEVLFWREVYARTVATLISAGVIYVIAALAGLVDTRPLVVVGIVIVATTTPPLVYWWADMIRHWKDLRITHDWSHTPPRSDAEVRIRAVYTRAFPFGAIWVVGAGLICGGIFG